MDVVTPKMYMMQTNGLLLDKLEPKYINRLNTLLVSIDGDEALTDYYRGKGTYRRVIENLKLIKQTFQWRINCTNDCDGADRYRKTSEIPPAKR
jgi:sulfatase maturation enzyme AslB (radical SAM superfamily)